MSVVIIGGKVFIEMPGNFRGQIGTPDLMVLFTATVSHKMIACALQEAARSNAAVERSHTSSSNALKNILSQYCPNDKVLLSKKCCG